MFDYYNDLTLDQIRFEGKGRLSIDVGSLDPVLFSETMRDIDLLVTRAGIGEAYVASPATISMRSELVIQLTSDLAPGRVSIEGQNAILKGKLAEYRVHRGTGNIYLGGSQYVCVVPDRTLSRRRVFLPFEDEDPKTSEVISKVLFLLEDEKIKDQGILNQIHAFINGGTQPPLAG
jgi:hypothetical protein